MWHPAREPGSGPKALVTAVHLTGSSDWETAGEADMRQAWAWTASAWLALGALGALGSLGAQELAKTTPGARQKLSPNQPAPREQWQMPGPLRWHARGVPRRG